MKNPFHLKPKLILLIVFLTVHCSLFTVHCKAQQGQWTWMNGTNTPDQPGVNSGLGNFAAGNTPPCLYDACEWTDLNGMFWLFGGMTFGNGLFQDMWEFNPYTNMWALIKGSTVMNLPGVYGVQGVPSPTNIPGGRFSSATWIDSAGDLWLFAGSGEGDSTIYNGELNDLWRYHIATNEWTWMNGSDTFNNIGSYGIRLVPAATNLPPARHGTNASWTDNNDSLWLFGGYVNNVGTYSDLWNYSTSTNEWTWIKGPNAMNVAGIYGSIGVPDTGNNPSCRSVVAKWNDHAGNFYMFAGNKSNFNNLNDMWRFTPSTYTWTWLNGGNVTNDTTVDDGLCITDAVNVPGARSENRACWTRPCDNFVFFGGLRSGAYNDLWNYSVSTNQWTLINGTTAAGMPGWFGTEDSTSALDKPPSKYGSIGWKDTLGNLWLFGGETNVFWSDMFKFLPNDSTCPHIGHENAISSFVDTPRAGCVPYTVNFHNNSTNGSYFYWNFGDASTVSSVVSPSHTYTAPGTYYVSLVAISSCFGNTDTARDTIVVYPLPTPVITSSSGSDTFCYNTTINLTTQSYSSYLWNTHINSTTQSITLDSTATYYVTVTDSNGCTATASQYVYVIPKADPIGSFFSDTVNGCTPFIVHFQNFSSNASSYFWNFGDGSTSNDTSFNVYHTYTFADSARFSVYLVAYNTSPCGVITDTAFQNNLISVNIFNPVAAFTSNYLLPIYTGDSIHFQDESYDANFTSYLTFWQWAFGDSDSSRFINPSHSWDLPGMYKVELTVTDNKGCLDTVSSYIDVIEGWINIPNVFSPNNDGYNDFFEITTSGMQVYNLEIYNRWGELEFQTNGKHIFWDGYNQNGIQCPDGTYYYTLNATGYSSKDFSKAGFILLLR